MLLLYQAVCAPNQEMAVNVTQLFSVFGRWYYESSRLCFRLRRECDPGFVSNEDKYHWELVRVGEFEWLRFVIDSI